MDNTVKKEDYKGYEIEIWYDTHGVDSPEDWHSKNELMLVSFHRNYGKKHDFGSPEEVIEFAKEKKWFIYPVFMYEHSGVAFSLSDFGDRWDSGQYGYLIFSKAVAKTKKQADKFAQSWIKEYSSWANGEVYGFTVNKPDGEMLESVGGYIGDYDYAIQEAKDIVDHDIKSSREKYFSKKKAQIKAGVPMEKREAYPFESGASGFTVLPEHKQKYMTVAKGKHKGERVKLYLEGKIGKQDYVLAKWRGAGYLKIKNRQGEAILSDDQSSPIIRESVGNPVSKRSGIIDGHTVDVYEVAGDNVADRFTVVIDDEYVFGMSEGGRAFNQFAGEMSHTFKTSGRKGFGKKLYTIPEHLIKPIKNRLADNPSDKPVTIDDIITHNKVAGKFFFSKDTMRSFGTKVFPEVFQSKVNPNLYYFITSDWNYDKTSKDFKIREYNRETGGVRTAPDFSDYFATKQTAIKHLQAYLEESNQFVKSKRPTVPMKTFSLRELKNMPTIQQGHTDNLKLDLGNYRVWLSRLTVADGMPYNNQVTVEKMVDGRWETVKQYQAR